MEEKRISGLYKIKESLMHSYNKDQEAITNYFSKEWPANHGTGIYHYRYSGQQIIDQILPGQSVIDVGCGLNLFKQKLPNLIGIDPSFDEADEKVTLEDFKTDKTFDVALCLGSINFGNEDYVLDQISRVLKLLKSNGRIFWRCNPGLADHGSEECKKITFFPWSIEKHVKYAEMFNCTLQTCLWDTNYIRPNQKRLYAEWRRRD